jgi:hypothetical protein
MSQRRNPVLSRGALFILAALLVGSAAFAQPVGGERFTANLVDPAGNFGRSGQFGRSNTAPVLIHIDHYSSEAEVQRLAGILSQKGPNALRDALWDREDGFIRVGGGLGYPIAAARSRPGDNGGRVIRIMIDRPISQREVIENTRTVDYPFTFIEIKLDRNGKGEGQFFAAAKVRMSGDTLDVESYSPQPLRLLTVSAREAGQR